uniref:Uncharacterized protein n=1 Tax=Arundo donax TaxID=35708 RepID=A0A0A8ZQU8_ARUDO
MSCCGLICHTNTAQNPDFNCKMTDFECACLMSLDINNDLQL